MIIHFKSMTIEVAMGLCPNGEPLLLQLKRIVRVGVRDFTSLKLSQLGIMHDCVEFICKFFSLAKCEWNRDIPRL